MAASVSSLFIVSAALSCFVAFCMASWLRASTRGGFSRKGMAEFGLTLPRVMMLALLGCQA